MKKPTFVLGILLTVLLIFIFASKKPSPDPSENANNQIVEIALQKIFETQNINKISDFQYIINNKIYYARTIDDLDKNGSREIVVMEPKIESGKIYRFYRKNGDNFQFIGEEGSVIWYFEEEKNREIELILKDVTGDGTSEIFVPFEQNAKGNKWYSVFRFSSIESKLENLFFNHYSENKPSRVISFDNLNYQNNRLIADWHGTYERGKSSYRLENNIFISEKTIGLFGQPRSENYEYREINESGDVTYQEKRTGSVWVDSIEREKLPQGN